VEALKFVGFVLVENLVVLAFLGGIAWWLVSDLRKSPRRRPNGPRGPCVNGTNCRAFLPRGVSWDHKTGSYRQNENVPPMCATCPFVNRDVT
jgi:hypothetical protein